MYRPIAATVLALCASYALAQPSEEQPLAAPPAPQSRVAGDPTEPEINISEQAEGMVYEYRVRGRVYMVKVQPQIGPPYYFFDSNGDGILDTRSDSPTNAAVQQWIVTSW
jgi:hypothetical protein